MSQLFCFRPLGFIVNSVYCFLNQSLEIFRELQESFFSDCERGHINEVMAQISVLNQLEGCLGNAFPFTLNHTSIHCTIMTCRHNKVYSNSFEWNGLFLYAMHKKVPWFFCKNYQKKSASFSSWPELDQPSALVIATN